MSEIVQLLRCAQREMTADAIAAHVGTSGRTVSRDIEALIEECVPIRDAAGASYLLDRGADLPPVALTLDEIEALMLGAFWVKEHADPTLARAAVDLLSKVAQSLPKGLRDAADDPAVGTPPARFGHRENVIDVGRLRVWSRQECKLAICYVDGAGVASQRTVWPFLVGYSATSRMLMAWCELRQGFRMFRTDRLASVEFLDERYPENRVSLRRRWLTWMEARRTASDSPQHVVQRV